MTHTVHTPTTFSTSGRIRYRKGYKYQLSFDYTSITRIRPVVRVSCAYLVLTTDGELTVYEGYAWDGPSGPTLDTRNAMRGSLGHDAKYQLIRLGLLSPSDKVIADEELQEDCLDDGMSRLRAWLWWRSVHYYGAPATRPSAEPVIMSAP